MFRWKNEGSLTHFYLYTGLCYLIFYHRQRNNVKVWREEIWGITRNNAERAVTCQGKTTAINSNGCIKFLTSCFTGADSIFPGVYIIHHFHPHQKSMKYNLRNTVKEGFSFNMEIRDATPFLIIFNKIIMNCFGYNWQNIGTSVKD